MSAGHRIAVGAFVAVLSFLVLASGAVVATPSTSGSTHVTSPSVAPTTASSSREQKLLAELRADHAPLSEAYLPNFNAHFGVQNATIRPDYPSTPAPMGIGDLGVRNVSGHDVGSVSYTSSVQASITVRALNSTYVDGYGPDSVSIQLNSVLTHVDLFNHTDGQFWIQNVPVYVESTRQLFFVDNIWNFSSPSFDLTQSSFWSFQGTPVPPVFYFANGPHFTTGFPFTIHVWNNASVVNDRPTVFLNYSVTLSSGAKFAGSYDRVEFNSTGFARPTSPAPAPTFQIDGQHVGANGALPNDAEIAIIGSGGGCTTSINNIDAALTLATLPNGTATFVPVPSAYNFGFETGETSEGIAEWTNGGGNPVAHLTAGPSLIGPLWGVTGAHPGHLAVSLHVQPANAFVFASPGGVFHAAKAAWAPLLSDGAGTYGLPVGTYTFEFLFSDHATKVLHVSASGSYSVVLSADRSVGIDTPLYAWGNGELANISQGGSGTIGHPYQLRTGGGTLDPLFGEFNDFEFPVFSGLFLAYTTDYVAMESSPSFTVPYSLPSEAGAVAAAGQPSTNELPMELLYAENVSIVHNAAIAGWFGGSLSGTMVGDITMWNSSHDLVADNTFDTTSIAVFVYGGSHTVISANTFVPSVPPCPVPSSILNAVGQQLGISLAATGDTVYNNAFEVPFPAVTPTTDPLTFLSSSYHDQWNVSSQPASDVRSVNGFALSGNILGGKLEGGNFWSTYGSSQDPYGVLPFNAAGGISSGGDHLPLTPQPLRKVTFTESGLPSGTMWTVTLNGTTFSTTGSSITFLDPSGAYGYTVDRVPGFTAHPASGAVRVGNGPANVPVRFT